MAVPKRCLNVVERTLIEVWLQDGWRPCAVTRALRRLPGTVSGKAAHHGGKASCRVLGR